MLGEKIRQLREQQELSLRELARQVNISPAFLSDIELGRRYPSERVLKGMASNLGISIGELRNYDTRAPVEEMRRLAESNPAYGIALRRVIDNKVSPEELLKLAGEKRRRTKKE
jgi:transcriptional regulator with XRE-family HTH domain